MSVIPLSVYRPRFDFTVSMLRISLMVHYDYSFHRRINVTAIYFAFRTQPVHVTNEDVGPASQPPVTSVVTTRQIRLSGLIVRAHSLQGHSCALRVTEWPSTVSQWTDDVRQVYMDELGFVPLNSSTSDTTMLASVFSVASCAVQNGAVLESGLLLIEIHKLHVVNTRLLHGQAHLTAHHLLLGEFFNQIDRHN